MDNKRVCEVPQYGLKVQLNHVYPENWSQNRIPRWPQIRQMLTLFVRYLWYYAKVFWEGRRAVMDYIYPLRAKQIYGVPLGGIGCGTIGRGFKGEFCRYQMRPGLYEYETIDANQFIVTIRDRNKTTIFQSVLSTFEKTSKTLKSWRSLIDPSKCQYTGLFPRSWTEYDLSDYGIKLACRQISPVIPHNYRDTSIPCGVFVWDIENCSCEDLDVTITFTFQNGIGVSKIDSKSTCSSKPFTYQSAEGVILYHTIDKTPCSYSIAAKSSPGVSVSKCIKFEPHSDGKQVWEQLQKSGRFEKVTDKRSPNVFGELGVAVAAQCSIAANSFKQMDFVLVWDMPIVSFFDKQPKYSKYYTKIFGADCALKMVDYALQTYPSWEEAIYAWQAPVLNNPDLPSWYKTALFNETYYVSDGGTVWFVLSEEEAMKLPANDPRREFGRFALLEGHEYRMFNTYDVHFYASFALCINWPQLQQCIQYDCKDCILSEVKQQFKELYNGHYAERKVIDTVPHDFGDPGEKPFILPNSYNIHDVSQWRDLTPKFVLQVYRDYCVSRQIAGKQYLEDMYDAMHRIMQKSEAFDTDNDGLIENSGVPDQTFDLWVMQGPSAYCGGLWLAALYAMTQICEVLKKPEQKAYYSAMLNKGKESFENRLWNGKCYDFDVVQRREGDIYAADQLCGHWYLRAASCTNYEVFPKDKVRLALRTIYQNNVMQFDGGNIGAVNGFTSKGAVDVTALQSEEVWTGVTYGLAAAMLQEGLDDEAWVTAGGMVRTMTERLGLSFQTPEALCKKDFYRSVGYMRPLSIWSMQLAIDARNALKE